MLKLKLQYFSHLMQTAISLGKTLMLVKTEGREEGDRGWDGWMASVIQWTWTWTNLGRSWGTGKPGVLQSTVSQRVATVHGITKSWTQLSDWTTRYVCVSVSLSVRTHVYLVAQSCLTLCNPIDCSPPGSSVHGDSPGKNTGVSNLPLLQGIFPTQGSNPCLRHCRQLYQLSYQGSLQSLL